MKLACIDAIAPGTTLKEKLKNLEKYGFDGIRKPRRRAAQVRRVPEELYARILARTKQR